MPCIASEVGHEQCIEWGQEFPAPLQRIDVIRRWSITVSAREAVVHDTTASSARFVVDLSDADSTLGEIPPSLVLMGIAQRNLLISKPGLVTTTSRARRNACLISSACSRLSV